MYVILKLLNWIVLITIGISCKFSVAENFCGSSAHVMGMQAFSLNDAQLSAQEHIDIDVLMVVEPVVYEENGREYVNMLLRDAIARTNAVFQPHGFTHKASIIDWIDNRVNESSLGLLEWTYAVGPVAYSYHDTFSQFIADPLNVSFGWQYVPEAHQLENLYQADLIVYVTNETNGADQFVIGSAYHNRGNIISFKGLEAISWVLAHELGHNLGFFHVSQALCNNTYYLMCAIAIPNQADAFLTNDEQQDLASILSGDTSVWPSSFDVRFWPGVVNEPMPIKAGVSLTVLDNPIASNIAETDVVVELVDQQGDPTVVNDDSSIQLFTRGDTALNGIHYDESVYQRVTFLAGEYRKIVSLSVAHDEQETRFTLGADSGLFLSDANELQVTIDSSSGMPRSPAPRVTEASINNDEEQKSDKSSGGSLQLTSLLLLFVLFYYRYHIAYRHKFRTKNITEV